MLGSWGFVFYIKYKISIPSYLLPCKRTIIWPTFSCTYLRFQNLHLGGCITRHSTQKSLDCSIGRTGVCDVLHIISFPWKASTLLSILLFKKVKDLAQASVSFVRLSLCHVPTNRPQNSCGCYVAWPSPIFQGGGLWALPGTWSSVGHPCHFSFPWLGDEAVYVTVLLELNSG